MWTSSRARPKLTLQPKRSSADVRRLRVRRLKRNELPADTVELARYLIGKTLVHDVLEGRMSGRIVETEAYVPGDSACHAFRGPTPRNRALFLERGYSYVYFIYGSSFMLNVSSEVEGVGAGVLLRALEPLEGIDVMRFRRDGVRVQDLTRGPGRLAAAMWIEKELNAVESMWRTLVVARQRGEAGRRDRHQRQDRSNPRDRQTTQVLRARESICEWPQTIEQIALLTSLWVDT